MKIIIFIIEFDLKMESTNLNKSNLWKMKKIERRI